MRRIMLVIVLLLMTSGCGYKYPDVIDYNFDCFMDSDDSESKYLFFSDGTLVNQFSGYQNNDYYSYEFNWTYKHIKDKLYYAYDEENRVVLKLAIYKDYMRWYEIDISDSRIVKSDVKYLNEDGENFHLCKSFY